MNWDNIADAYLSISEDRDKIIFPFLSKVINENQARSIVDVGGGDGRFIELVMNFFGHDHFDDIALTDTSARMRERAHTRLRTVIDLSIVESPKYLKRDHWDIVTFIAVWMSLETEEQCIEALSEIKDLLNKNGKLIAAITHPCFRGLNYHSFSANFDLSDYFRSGMKFRVNLYDNTRSLAIWDTHWTLSDHTRQLQSAGFVIDYIVELPDIDGSSEGAPWLVFVASVK